MNSQLSDSQIRSVLIILSSWFRVGQMKYTPSDHAPIKIARVYLRVSTDEQDLTRQTEIERSARATGYYIAGIYREKASGARADRPELLRMIADLQPGEVVVAEKIDRISRLPLAEAEQLVASIRTRGARLAVPGLVDLSDFAAETDGVARIVLESVQELLLKLALQMARDDFETRRERQRQGVQLAKAAGKYAGRAPDTAAHHRIVALRAAGHTIHKTAALTACSASQVKRIWALHLQAQAKPVG
jgi:DNA invertase Pin-like site-specific DNA recombinase